MRCIASGPEPDETLPSIDRINSKCGAVNTKGERCSSQKIKEATDRKVSFNPYVTAFDRETARAFGEEF